MNPADPLAALHPLREPAAVGWWPPAPGWWILLALCLLGLVALLFLLLRRYRANAYRRAGLRRLHELRRQYQAQPDPAAELAAVNALLKSTALHAYPRSEIAAQSGVQWLEFLNTALPGSRNFQAEFASAAYMREVPGLDIQALHDSAAEWIKCHRRSR